MYTMILDQGTVTRDSDGKIIAPCESEHDVNFIEYNDWINSGNEPTIYDTKP